MILYYQPKIVSFYRLYRAYSKQSYITIAMLYQCKYKALSTDSLLSDGRLFYTDAAIFDCSQELIEVALKTIISPI
jgi:hypothetical protein